MEVVVKPQNELEKKWFEDGDSDTASEHSNSSEEDQNLETSSIVSKSSSVADELEEEPEESLPSDPKELLQLINDIVSTLSNFKSYRSQAANPLSRSQLLSKLLTLLSSYFSFTPSLTEHFSNLFSPSDLLDFLTASSSPRPLIIRVNRLKSSRKDLMETLTARGVRCEPLENFLEEKEKFGEVGIKVFDSSVPIGATPEYLAGHYTIQAASSFLPVLALRPKDGSKCLDMSSAPGGKASFICQMNPNGLVVCNDISKDRSKATVANLARLGCKNSVHVVHDGRALPKVLPQFDFVLLDAPCSGTGVISRHENIKSIRTHEDILKRGVLQKQLLLSAIDCCKIEGIVVYSTCSVSVEENEAVVQYALENRGVKIVDSGLSEGVGDPGLGRFRKKVFHPSMKKARRMYPHKHNMDGFFVVRLRKVRKKGKDDVRVAFGSSLTNKEKKKRKREKKEEKRKNRKV
eukprot:augustus_masked-scaffold_94-processed-gene-0.33-mRNA-1 protein AED:0.01 eAED:0.01 QI:0/-1/0/1/-1/1/1/0/461